MFDFVKLVACAMNKTINKRPKSNTTPQRAALARQVITNRKTNISNPMVLREETWITSKILSVSYVVP
jgi:hypothetical protein